MLDMMQASTNNNPMVGMLSQNESSNPMLDMIQPQGVTQASSDIGRNDFNGECEAYVEKTLKLPNMGTTAVNAWNNWVDKGKAFADYQKAPAGSLVYFAPDAASNENAGHVAISDGRGNILGATDNGVQKYKIDDWIKQTGQTPLGYVKP